jgi:hypothetical protein
VARELTLYEDGPCNHMCKDHPRLVVAALSPQEHPDKKRPEENQSEALN